MALRTCGAPLAPIEVALAVGQVLLTNAQPTCLECVGSRIVEPSAPDKTNANTQKVPTPLGHVNVRRLPRSIKTNFPKGNFSVRDSMYVFELLLVSNSIEKLDWYRFGSLASVLKSARFRMLTPI